MTEKHKENSLTWYPYDVASNLASTMQLSLAARGLDQILTDHAWSNVDGSCSVDVTTLMGLCEREKLDAKALYGELVASKRWERQDKQVMVAPWLQRLRGRADAIVEKRRKAALVGVEKRREKAEAKNASRAKAKGGKSTQREAGVPAVSVSHDLPESPREQVLSMSSHDLPESPDVSLGGAEMEAPNPLQENDLSMCSAKGEQRTASSTSSLPTVEKEVEEEAGAVAPALSADAAACHAEGASAPSASAALPVPVPVPRRVPNLRVLMVEEQLRDTVVTPGWMDRETAALVQQLGARGTLLRVDVERALGLLYAPLCSDRTPLGHAGLRDEIGALLRGEAGRDSYLPTEHAYEAVICALFGALTHRTPRISPLLFRAIATETAKAMVAQPEADGRELAAEITNAFDRGVSKASGYTLPHECTTPSRLNGHPTRTEASAG
jgi:hypothetical protein